MSPETRVAECGKLVQITGSAISLRANQGVGIARIATITAPLAQNPQEQATVIAPDHALDLPLLMAVTGNGNGFDAAALGVLPGAAQIHSGMQVMRQGAA